jgi:hypothetical protein
MPTLEITLDARTAQHLHTLSKLKGRADSEVAATLLSDALRDNAAPLGETELLARISRGWEPELWDRFHDLSAKRRDETLTDAEYAELAQLTEERDLLNAERLSNLIALANLRGVDLTTVMTQLDIPNTRIA